MASDHAYHAVVQKLIPNGKHGPYAVARCEGLGIVTFSLDANVWRERDWPEPGMCVVLSQIRKKRAGWRAQSGRFFEPSDEQNPEQKAQEN